MCLPEFEAWAESFPVLTPVALAWFCGDTIECPRGRLRPVSVAWLLRETDFENRVCLPEFEA